MAYLQEFVQKIENSDFPKILVLWEEYTNNDQVDPVELSQILHLFKKTEVAPMMGKYVATALHLWDLIEDKEKAYEILKLIIDLQTTNTAILADLSTKLLEEKFGLHPQFAQRIRLIGLRSRDDFQGAISNYELLAHMAKGKFVYHIGEWGVGEIVEISPVREEVTIEFENVGGRRDLSFKNGFKVLIPLPDDHFLARRFGNPDALEEEARNNPVEVIRLLLRDLGPKTASEIKDEMADWIIPESEWSKWWQSARSKIKKDTKIETPKNIKLPFRIREEEISHEDRMHKEIHGVSEAGEIILTSYNYVRDFPNMLKKEEVRQSIIEKLSALLKDKDLVPEHELQIAIFLETQLQISSPVRSVQQIVEDSKDIEDVVNAMEILAFKKRALMSIRKHRSDWQELFLKFLYSVEQNTLRDFILGELNNKDSQDKLMTALETLLEHPEKSPDLFVWYFQKIISDGDVPFADKEGRRIFLEAFLILYSRLEGDNAHRDLIKKMYTIITGKRYLIVREIIEGADLDFIREFVLLVTKCQTLPNHDVKNLRSLAKVVQPSIDEGEKEQESSLEETIIWTSEDGYNKTKIHLDHLVTSEMVSVAKEIGTAREHGDLRENAEYKAALERRSRLQGDIKMLSDQINMARIIRQEDVPADQVGIGSVVHLMNSAGKKISYTILGPWDANPDKNILSYKSKLAEAMIGHKLKETFSFKGEKFTIEKLGSYLD